MITFLHFSYLYIYILARRFYWKLMMFGWMQAISTYNYLIEEGRVVAAALIPPLYVK